MADTDSVDSKEEQAASVDNTCYMKLSSKLQPFILDSITIWHLQFSWISARLHNTIISNFSKKSNPT